MLLPERVLLLTLAFACSACSSRAPNKVANVPPTRLEGIDLLHATPTTVTVSTSFLDRLDQVSFIADNDEETAWSSYSELEGAFIEVRVPDDARVTGFSMSVGCTLGDAFQRNPRIARVSVSHEGLALHEYDLDVESRALQTIPLEGPGGLYRIDVESVVRPTSADAARVFVAELRVWGTPGSIAASRPTFPLDRRVFDPNDDLGPVHYQHESITRAESLAAMAAFVETWSDSDASEEALTAAAREVPIQTNPAAQCEWSDTLLRIRRARLQRVLDRWIANARRELDSQQNVPGHGDAEAREYAIHRVEVFRERSPRLTVAQTLRTRPPEGDTFAAAWGSVRSGALERRWACY